MLKYIIWILACLLMSGCAHEITKSDKTETTVTITHKLIDVPPVKDSAVAVIEHLPFLGVPDAPQPIINSTPVLTDPQTLDLVKKALKGKKLVGNTVHGSVTYDPNTNLFTTDIKPPPVQSADTNKDRLRTIVKLEQPGFFQNAWTWIKGSIWIVLIGCALVVIVPFAIKMFLKFRP